jgi:hypothetical protein
MFQLNGSPISIDNEITINGVRYPHLRDPALREQLGIVEVADDPWYDQRFYWGVDNPKLLDDRLEVKEDGTPLFVQVYDPAANDGKGAMVDTTEQVVTKGLKSEWIAQVKATAGSLLAQSDWKVTRAAEGIKPVDADTLARRSAIRAYSDSLEAQIKACTTVEALITVVTNQSWGE